MIELEDITKQYRRTAARRSSTRCAASRCASAAASFVAIAGASGSGKSTLMNVLGLLDRPDAGRYLLRRTRGVDAERPGAGAGCATRGSASSSRPSTCCRGPARSRTWSCRSSTRTAPTSRGLGRRALELVGLADRVTHTPAELSGGQQQRVAIARALVNEPDLMLADEPTGNLDSESAAEILAMFEALHRAGRTIVIVTHDAAVAARCPRRIRIEDGRVVEDTQPLQAGPPSAGSDAGHPALQEVR